jgi:hypothetical protein
MEYIGQMRMSQTYIKQKKSETKNKDEFEIK